MSIVRFVIILVALVMGSWFAFDGIRALTVGDYVTAKSGPHAGQLGPWWRLVSAVGLDPRGLAMKCVHVAFGAAWLAASCVFVFRPPEGRWSLLVVAALSLWYLPIGTVLGLVEIILLLCLGARSSP